VAGDGGRKRRADGAGQGLAVGRPRGGSDAAIPDAGRGAGRGPVTEALGRKRQSLHALRLEGRGRVAGPGPMTEGTSAWR